MIIEQVLICVLVMSQVNPSSKVDWRTKLDLNCSLTLNMCLTSLFKYLLLLIQVNSTTRALFGKLANGEGQQTFLLMNQFHIITFNQ